MMILFLVAFIVLGWIFMTIGVAKDIVSLLLLGYTLSILTCGFALGFGANW